MFMTTTPSIEGHAIESYQGVVTASVVVGANIFRDFFAAVRDVVGGRAASYERALSDTVQSSIDDLQNRARALGANAIVGIRFDVEALGKDGTIMLVLASGTAVVAK